MQSRARLHKQGERFLRCNLSSSDHPSVAACRELGRVGVPERPFRYATKAFIMRL